jgi:hypothetical protein
MNIIYLSYISKLSVIDKAIFEVQSGDSLVETRDGSTPDTGSFVSIERRNALQPGIPVRQIRWAVAARAAHRAAMALKNS